MVEVWTRRIIWTLWFIFILIPCVLIGIGLCLKGDDEPEPFRSEVFAEVLNLPEVVRYSQQIRDNSKGKARMVAYLEGQAGPGVWDVYVGENHPSHTVRWATFRVDSASGSIAVSEPNGEFISREEWLRRRSESPSDF